MSTQNRDPRRLLRLALTIAVVLAVVLALAACGHNSY
jgi:hypothetical protein